MDGAGQGATGGVTGVEIIAWSEGRVPFRLEKEAFDSHRQSGHTGIEFSVAHDAVTLELKAMHGSLPFPFQTIL